jgi:hypothetical protein
MISVCNRPEMWNKDVVNNDTSPPNSRDTLSPISASVPQKLGAGGGGSGFGVGFSSPPMIRLVQIGRREKRCGDGVSSIILAWTFCCTTNGAHGFEFVYQFPRRADNELAIREGGPEGKFKI